MRACARVALASIAVSASFSLSGGAAIEELKETFLRWVESQKLPSGRGVSVGKLPEATPVVPPRKTPKEPSKRHPQPTDVGLSCPKDLRVLPGHPEPAVSWHNRERLIHCGQANVGELAPSLFVPEASAGSFISRHRVLYSAAAFYESVPWKGKLSGRRDAALRQFGNPMRQYLPPAPLREAIGRDCDSRASEPEIARPASSSQTSGFAAGERVQWQRRH